MKEQILELMSKPGYKALVPRQIMEQIGSDNLTNVMKCLNIINKLSLLFYIRITKFIIIINNF